MRSYIKIYGPPVLKAIKSLEKIAIDMPEVCIMSSVMEKGLPINLSSDEASLSSQEGVMNYFSAVGDIDVERCNTIISKSGVRVGEYDFYFEWFKDPDMYELNTLVEKIDEALTPLGCRYTITTKP